MGARRRLTISGNKSCSGCVPPQAAGPGSAFYLPFGNLATGQVGADRERREGESQREAELGAVAPPHEGDAELHHRLSDRLVDHCSSPFPSFRTLCAMRLCSEKSSMKPGLAACEKAPPDSPKPAIARS